MTVSKSGTTAKPWRADIRDSFGKRHRPTFKTRRQAEDFEDEIRRLARSGSRVDPKLAKKTTVGMVWPKYIQRVREVGTTGRRPAKPHTVADYEQHWNAHVSRRWEGVPLSEIDPIDVAEWVAHMPPAKGARGNERVAGARPRAESAKLLRRILDHAVRERYIESNPALDALGKMPNLPSPRRKSPHQPLTMHQLKTLAAAAGEIDPQWEGFILLAGTSAPRFGEITALQGRDVERGKRPKIYINRAWSDVRGQLISGLPKGNRTRVSPVLPSVARQLPDVVGTELLWRGPRGGVVRNGWFRERILRPAILACQEADPTFPNIVPHDLRHTAISIAISTGTNIKVIQNLAGHESSDLTLDVYGEMLDQDQADMVSAAEAAFHDHTEDHPAA